MRKILIITSSLQLGGIERVSTSLANAFSEAGYVVSFLTIFRHKKFFSLKEEIFCIEPGVGIPQRLNILTAPVRIRRSVKKFNPDTILVFNKFYGALTLLGLMFCKVPVYITERASPHYRFPLPIHVFNKIIFSLFSPDGIIAQTNYAATFQREYYKNGVPVKVINNPLSEIKSYNLPRKKVVIAVGRLNDRLKGFDLLIEAFSIIKNQDWQLQFAGNKIEESGLKVLVKEKNLDDRVIFLGQVTDIDKLYSEAGIFVLPSRSEGFPNALVEAMACGAPCISFKCKAGPEEIITHNENGLLVEADDVKALAEAIDFLIENPLERNRIGENAKKVRNRFDKDVIAMKYLDFILS